MDNYNRILDWIEKTQNQRQYQTKLELKRFGRNIDKTPRVLLYATEGTNLNSYILILKNNKNQSESLFHFPNYIMENDEYVCLFINAIGNARIRDRRIKTFHININDFESNENEYEVSLLKILSFDKLRINEENG